MKPNLDPISPDVESLLANERELVAQSEPVRRRALARARAAMSSSSTPAKTRLGLRGFGWMTAAAALLGAATLSAAAIRTRRSAATHLLDAATLPQTKTQETPAAPGASLQGGAEERTDVDPPKAPAHAAPPLSPRAATSSEGYGPELKVLQPARTAVARSDFATALSAIAEHERRFAAGQLVEEREALRVQALWGLHRTDEARHAAIAFRKRFPESVLLSRMKEALQSTP